VLSVLAMDPLRSVGDEFASVWPRFLTFWKSLQREESEIPSIPDPMQKTNDGCEQAYNIVSRVFESMGDDFNAQVQLPTWSPTRKALVETFLQSATGNMPIHRRTGLVLDSDAISDAEFAKLKRYVQLFSLLCYGDMSESDSDDDDSDHGPVTLASSD